MVTEKAKKQISNGHSSPNAVPEYISLEERSDIPWDTKKIASFKDKHLGQRCFIIGNGPSLKKTDLNLLAGEVTFAVNSIFLAFPDTVFRPTYYSVCDSFVIEENTQEICDLTCEHKFFPSTYRKFIPASARQNVSFFRLNRGFNEKTSPNHGISRFSSDCSERIYDNQTVTYINMQLAYYMGFSEVYLIGIDFSYTIPDSAIIDGCNITSTEDDPNHFHPQYFGKGRSWHDPVLHRVVRGYQFSRLVYEWADRTVYNATVGGKLEVYKRRDYYSLFSDQRQANSLVFDSKHTAQGQLLGPVVKSGSLSALMISPQSNETLNFRAPFFSHKFVLITLLSDMPIDIDGVSLRFNHSNYSMIDTTRLFETGDEILFYGADIMISFTSSELVESLNINYSIKAGSILYLQSIKAFDQDPFNPSATKYNPKVIDLNANAVTIGDERIISSALLMYKARNYSAALELYIQAKERYNFKSLDVVIAACKKRVLGAAEQ
jgi:hypothetical protein